MMWTEDFIAQLWDLESDAPPVSFGIYVNSAAFSPDGTRIVTASNDNETWPGTPSPRLWDWDTNTRELKQHKFLKGKLGHERVTITAAYSPDGSRVVTTSEDGTARTWDAESGALLAVLEIAESEMWGGGWIRAAAFSPDGTMIVAGGRVWDAETGEKIANLAEEKSTEVAFSPDGRRVASGRRVWLLPPPARDDPEWLQLSIELRSGFAWDEETRRPYPLSAEELKTRQDRLVVEYEGRSCDAPEWDDPITEENPAPGAPGR